MMNLVLTPTTTATKAQLSKVQRAFGKIDMVADQALLEGTVGAFLAAGVDPSTLSSSGAAKLIRENAATLLGQAIESGNEATETQAELHITTPRWDVNTKFSFLSKLVNMVITEVNPSCVILGDGGLGKTFTVKQQLALAGLNEDDDYVFISGTSTAAGLYRFLYENNGKLIVFDDCDAVLKEPTAVNVLKAALDSYAVRKIAWLSTMSLDGIPSTFEFNGRVIFISNLSMDKIPEPIVSRSLSIDLTMTGEEKITRMQSLLPDLETDVELEKKEEVLELLKANQKSIRNLNLRTLLKAIRIRKAYENDGDWRELALFAVLS
jgi:hypothetical protein